ncbi:MAG: hypothetical protein GX230_09360 [Lentisphaerae bacterium]|nr:hypothetical protein [Lentisphaerota bacterium]
MKRSPLQLENYFITALNVTANRDYNPQQGGELKDEGLEIEPYFTPKADSPRSWQVILHIQLQSASGRNVPYYFMVEIVGFFTVSESYPDDKIEWLVRTNATSVLYSTAREILRNTMAQGPFSPLLLPTASFYLPETFKMLEKNEEKG